MAKTALNRNSPFTPPNPSCRWCERDDMIMAIDNSTDLNSLHFTSTKTLFARSTKAPSKTHSILTHFEIKPSPKGSSKPCTHTKQSCPVPRSIKLYLLSCRGWPFNKISNWGGFQGDLLKSSDIDSAGVFGRCSLYSCGIPMGVVCREWGISPCTPIANHHRLYAFELRRPSKVRKILCDAIFSDSFRKKILFFLFLE